MCDKIAISTYIMKIAENDPFLRLQMRAIEMFNRHQFVFLWQTIHRDWTDAKWDKSVEYFFSKGEILIEMIKNVKIVII